MSRSTTVIPSGSGILVAVAWVAALSLIAWVGVILFWRFAAPTPVVALASHQPDPQIASREIAAALGGRVALQHETAAAAVGTSQYKLEAIATGFGALPGFAVLRKPDGSSLGLRVGERTPDGLVLTRIAPDHVEFDQGRILRFPVAHHFDQGVIVQR